MNERMLLVVGLWVFGACTPTLMPVFSRAPLVTQTHAPRVIWVFDNSGSMLQPTNPAAAGCPANCGTAGNPCPRTCQTRHTQLIDGLAAFQSQLPAATTHASVVYATDALCGPPDHLSPTPLFSDVVALVSQLVPAGGTPTAAALRYVASVPAIAQTETFVVLLTDGAPNCNPENPANLCHPPDPSDGGADAGPDPLPQAIQACNCTTSTCAFQLCSLGCRDDLAMVAAAHQLAEREQRLVVIGLGADFGVSAVRSSFSSMELAVGPSCTSSLDCGGTPCGADGVCQDKLFTANTTGDFETAAQRLGAAVKQSARCTFWLPRQVTAADLTVELGGATVDAAQWSLVGNAEQRVVLSGAACERLLAGTETPTISWLPPSP